MKLKDLEIKLLLLVKGVRGYFGANLSLFDILIGPNNGIGKITWK